MNEKTDGHEFQVETFPPLPPGPGKTRDKIGAMFGVSGRTIQKAMFVKREAPDLAALVTSGEMPLERAYRAAKDRRAELERRLMTELMEGGLR